eukprot:gene7495-15335_t
MTSRDISLKLLIGEDESTIINRLNQNHMEIKNKDDVRSKLLVEVCSMTLPDEKEFWKSRIEVVDKEMTILIKEREMLLSLEASFRQNAQNILNFDQEVNPTQDEKGKQSLYHVLGMGVAGMDFMLRVEKYPKEDEKIRTTSYKTSGGGNVANTLTALSRLGIQASLFSIMGTDSTGDLIAQELEIDGVNTTMCVRTSCSPSALTHIIVDNESNSRTCLHTAMTIEISDIDVENLWNDYNISLQNQQNHITNRISLIHLDSRQTKAAISLARLGNKAGIPVSIDVEKHRPHLHELIPLCDLIFTNKHFPSLYMDTLADKTSCIEAMATLLHKEGNRARAIITTLGSSGSLVIHRMDDLLTDLRPVIDTTNTTNNTAYVEDQNIIQTLNTLLSQSPLNTTSALENVSISDSKGEPYTVCVQVVRCSAWPLRTEDVVDSTGAGDSFIGGFISAFLRGADIESLQRKNSEALALDPRYPL